MDSVKNDKNDKIKKAASAAAKRAKSAAGKAKSAVNTTKSFVQSVKDDVAAVRERDPAAKSDMEVLLLYSGVHALIAHRIAHGLYKKEKYLPARAISQFAKMVTGIEIHPGATIGKGFVIDHGSGVVIGETAEIGDNCTVYQGVTLGGTGKDIGKRHPTLGNNVMVGAGAKVLGPFYIGDNTKIAANAVVLKEIPENCTAVGIPAKVVRREGVKVEDTLDQIHIPDPVAQEIKRLEERINSLEAELNEKTTKKKK
jgi:serine O-acetyltransferase